MEISTILQILALVKVLSSESRGIVDAVNKYSQESRDLSENDKIRIKLEINKLNTKVQDSKFK